MARYRQIIVAGTPTGLQGLDDVLARFYADGYAPEETGLGQALVRAVGEDNYIPRSAHDVFAEALVREYRLYLARQERGEQTDAPEYGTWRGYPRETIPWFPSIHADLCDGCGRCLELCSHQALAPTDAGKVRVGDPFRCVVGCSSCANICQPGAITFPPRSMLNAYTRR
jgi:NAD-dependent dihydropyrimidine dehydrogenase PreA subunit